MTNQSKDPQSGEEVPPWEKLEERVETEEVTATTKTFIGDNAAGTGEETIITKPADRVHAEIFGGGESLFGHDSAWDRLRFQLGAWRNLLEEWWPDHRGLGWALMGGAGLFLLAVCLWMAWGRNDSVPADRAAAVGTPAELTPPPASGPAVAELAVLTEPAGARVILDGQEQSSLTPLHLQGVSVGEKHVLELEREGYESYRSEVTLTAGVKNELRLNLQPKGIKVDVRSEPPGAEIRINGKVVGVTPSEGSFNIYLDPQQKQLQVELKHDGYEPYAAVYPVGPQGLEIDARLLPQKKSSARPAARAAADAAEGYGTLNLKAKPWAIVYINDKRLPRRTPVQSLKWRAGKHKIQFVNPQNGKKQTVIVNLGAGAERSYEVDLR